MEKVLSDIRVLDFGRFVAGPFCSMLLADMGAEVIRVERSDGEEDRTVGLLAQNGENMFFPAVCRNKKGITLNLSNNVTGQAVLKDLLQHVDVVVHAFTPVPAKMMGLDYENLKKIKPDIIVAAVSCFGQEGPYSNRPGFDFIAQAMSGCMALGGYEDKPPIRAFMTPIDYATGITGAYSVSIAIRHRDKTGKGQMIDLSLLRTAIQFATPVIGEMEVLNTPRPMIGNRGCYVGTVDLLKCKDGSVFVACIMNSIWRRLTRLIGHEELLDDPELQNDYQRYIHRDRIDPLVAEWAGRYTVEEVMQKMGDAHIPCGPYRSLGEVSADPHVQETEMIRYMDLKEPGLDRVPVSQTPVKMSETPPTIERRPPRVGEHNDEIYQGILGYSSEKIALLKEEGVI